MAYRIVRIESTYDKRTGVDPEIAAYPLATCDTGSRALDLVRQAEDRYRADHPNALETQILGDTTFFESLTLDHPDRARFTRRTRFDINFTGEDY